MTESFGWSAPSVADAADGHAIATALTFGVLTGGQISAVKVFSPTTAMVSLVFHLYEVTNDSTGTLLASKTVASPATASLITGTFDTPVTVTTDRAYRAAAYASDGHYVATLAAFTAADVTVGNLRAYKDGTSPFGSALNNGNFIYDSDVYPTSDGGGANFHVDVVFSVVGTDVSVDGTQAETFNRPGALLVDRQIAGDRSETFARPGVLTVSALPTGEHETAFDIAGSLSINGGTPPAPGGSGNGWWGLKNIFDEARREHEYWTTTPPMACPIDGEPLQTAPDGRLFCRFDGWPNA